MVDGEAVDGSADEDSDDLGDCSLVLGVESSLQALSRRAVSAVSVVRTAPEVWCVFMVLLPSEGLMAQSCTAP